MRFLFATALALLAASIAPPMAMADVTKVCEGKYAETAKVIDQVFQKNGTLYSGGYGYWPGQRGFYFHRLDNVSRTVNAYRVMKGLKPLGPLHNAYFTSNFHYDSFVRLEPDAKLARVKKALTIMTVDDPNMSYTEAVLDSFILDIITTDRPTSDWWLRPEDDFSDYKIMSRYQASGATGLKPFQHEIAKLAKDDPALDWLLANLVTARPQHQWTYDEDTELPDTLKSALTHVENKAGSGKNLNPYNALLPISLVTGRAKPDAKTKAAIKAVEACTASTSDYAILAAGKVFLGDEYMPPDLLASNLIGDAKYATLAPDFKFDKAYFDYLSSLKARTSGRGKTWFVMPMLYASKTREQFDQALDGFAEAYKGREYLGEPVSFLPVETLERISPAQAFTRYISLKRYNDARRVLDAAIKTNPKIGVPLQDILTADIPSSAAMSLAALRMKCVSHRQSNFCVAGEPRSRRRGQHTHRNIYRDRDAMGSSLFYWLECKGKHEGTVAGLSDLKSHGTYRVSYYFRSRYFSRNETPTCPGGRASLLEFPLHTALLSPDSAVNFENLKLYNDERRLSRALSEDIIEWAKTERKPRRFFSPKPSPHADLMAEGLHRVVYLNKHEGGGEIDEMPAGKRAFKLLHSRFAESSWTEKTKYWFPAGWVH